MRGEHLGYMIEALDAKGSSPHARGAQCLGAPRAEARGIIPACAGSTARMPNRCCRLGDHPRMRGEHLISTVMSAISGGSSPHARGAPRAAHRQAAVCGIIPACAGSTSCSTSSPATRRDHPRMRGEHIPKYTFTISFMGSSPHARGALRAVPDDAGAEGIIPACAGSTANRVAHRLHDRDHPRMRGEHQRGQNIGICLRGSSPHARGALHGRGRRAGAPRIIPACAGSTPHR